MRCCVVGAISLLLIWTDVASAVEVSQTSTPGSPILDYQTTSDTISVSDSLAIQDVRVGVDISHTFQGDLAIQIMSPTLASVTLTENAGGGANDVLVTFASGGFPFESAQLTAGLTYRMQALGPGAMSDFVAVDSAGSWTFSVYDDFGGDTGTLNEWSLFLSDTLPAPPNDTCDQSITVAESSVTAFQTLSAIASGITTSCAGTVPPLDVWYRIDVTCDADFTLSTCGSSFDTTLAVWSGTGGCPLPGDPSLACANDGCGLDAELTVFASAGQSLYVQVGGFSGATGEGVLTVTNDGTPTNDACADALEVFEGTTTFNTLCATTDGIHPGCGGFATPIDIWYTFTADCDGDVTIDTFGSLFDTRLAIWSGTACPGPGVPALYCNDDSGSPQTEIIVPAVTVGDTFLIQVGGSSIAAGYGQLNVLCDLPAAPPIWGLECTPSTGEIVVTWSVPSPLDEVLVYLDGALVAALPGSATSAVIDGLTESTTYEVCVETVRAGFSPTQTCCTVTTPSDATGVHVIFYGEYISGLVDSVAALEAALGAHGIDPVIVGPAHLSTVTVPPAVLWLILGTYPANHPLSPLDGETLVTLQAAGTAIYASGGDTFGFDPQTVFATIDGVAPDATDGDDTHDGMIGHDFLTGFDAPYIHDQDFSDYTDQLGPASSGQDVLGSDSRTLFSDDGSGGSPVPYDTGVAYYTSSGGRVVSMSTEFGGYDGDQVTLATALLEFFLEATVPTPGEFRRGDANGDSVYDISDAVYTLAALFVPSSPALACLDAADSNDDGAVDISDTVYTLAALFVPGSPSPGAPGVTSCGQDPTPDGLECVVYACP